MRTGLASAIFGLPVGWLICLVATAPAESDEPKPIEAAKRDSSRERFDHLVREDLFAGFGGDDIALARGLAMCEATLSKDPKHSEALVWRGAVRIFQASKHFAKKEMREGGDLWTKGLKDMDDAVELDPKNPGVRIPRAAVLLPAARNSPPFMSKPILKKVLDDFEAMTKLQEDRLSLDKMGEHPLGELRMGLADTYRLMGKPEKSTEQLRLIREQMPDTAYAERADEWLKAPNDAKLAHQCIGCHEQ